VLQSQLVAAGTAVAALCWVVGCATRGGPRSWWLVKSQEPWPRKVQDLLKNIKVMFTLFNN